MKLDEVQSAAREQFSRQSERYGRGHVLADTSDLAEALQQVTLPPAARVLDVATGAGHAGLYLAGLGHRVICSDIAEPMLEKARAAAAERGLKIETALHAAEELPYESGVFDLVMSRIAPHHFSSPAAFIAQTSRVLKPGGWFILIDGSVPDAEPEAEEWLHQVEKLRDPSHHRLLTPERWSELCETHGLRVQSAQLQPMKQPDLEWYFETAATSPDNREVVRSLVAGAADHVRQLFRLAEESGKTVWWWPRLTLVAQRSAEPCGYSQRLNTYSTSGTT